jgi:hypothetical protein
MSLRVAACVGWAALVAPAMASAQGGRDDAASHWEAVAACAALPDATSRHQCVDGVLRRSGALGEAQVAREASEQVRAEEAAVARRATAVPAGRLRPAQIDELVSTVSNVRSIGYNTYLITAAEGSMWEQTDAESFATEPKKGDAFTVERGLVGGYRCRFARSSLYPCRRVS